MLPSIGSQLSFPTSTTTPEDGQEAERSPSTTALPRSFDQTTLTEELDMWTLSSLPLLSLPPELIDRILCNLDLRSLLKCKQVCKKLKERIEHAKSIQYIMELEICGQELNPNNDWSALDSSKCLQQYRSTWETLGWMEHKTDPIKVPMKSGGLWELYGGVLGQTDEDGRFHFMKLPSPIRHIQEETWNILPDIPSTEIRDFGIDPGQDLLVWITAPNPSSPKLSLHLRTLKKAEQHPLARHGVIYHNQPTEDGRWHYLIKIMQDYIGLWAFYRPPGIADSTHSRTYFSVWNWKEDTLLLNIETPDTQSFAFVSDSHVVLADRYVGPFRPDGIEDTEAYLTLIDFKAEGPTEKTLKEVINAVKLCYPIRANVASYNNFDISSEPSPGWAPGWNDRAPFYTAKENRIFTVTITARVDSRDLAFSHFIPLPVFRECLDKLKASGKRLELQWAEWAPSRTRLFRSVAPASEVWVCFAFGSRCVTGSFRKTEPGSNEFHYRANVYDFNQLSIRKDLQEGKESNIIQKATTLKGRHTMWQEIVETSLPYRAITKTLLSPVWPSVMAMMCTADHIVVVNTSSREYLIFAN